MFSHFLPHKRDDLSSVRGTGKKNERKKNTNALNSSIERQIGRLDQETKPNDMQYTGKTFK